MKIDEENVIEYLTNNDLLDFGKVIPKQVIEKLLSVKLHDENDIQSVGPLLFLKSLIEEQGFLCERKGLTLKLLNAEDMWVKSENNFRNAMKKLKRNCNSMAKADISGLDESDKQKHYHASNKLIMGLQAMKSTLRTI
jgi:hypothetical protein